MAWLAYALLQTSLIYMKAAGTLKASWTVVLMPTWVVAGLVVGALAAHIIIALKFQD